MSPRRLALLSMAVAILLAGCDPGERKLSLPADPPLSGGLGWGLVQESYVRLMAEPVVGAAESGLLRDGVVAEIRARAVGTGEGMGGSWYLLAAEGILGWAPARSLVIYRSREQATRAAGSR